MNEQIKMNEEEVKEIRNLQEKFQKKVSQLGLLSLQKKQADDFFKNINEQETKLWDDWTSLQKEETELIDKLLKKYGEGSLDLAAGTFISEKKPTS